MRHCIGICRANAGSFERQETSEKATGYDGSSGGRSINENAGDCRMRTGLAANGVSVDDCDQTTGEIRNADPSFVFAGGLDGATGLRLCAIGEGATEIDWLLP